MRRSTRTAVLCAAAAATLVSGQAAFAASYASGVTESGGNVNFTLNEAAQDVIIYRDGVATSLGAQAAGTLSFARNGATNWQIQVVQSGGLGFGTALPSFATGNASLIPLGGVLQSQADSALTRFNAPRGVDVNTSTADLSLFGRVYVANSPTAAGTTASAALTPGVGSQLPARGATGVGLYALDARLTDVLGKGDTATTPAGISWDGVGGASPYRVTVAPDGSLYIADWSDGNGTAFRADANLTTGTNLFATKGGATYPIDTNATNHGSIGSVVAVTGSLAQGNLAIYTIDEDLQEPGVATATQLNSLWRYDVGSGPFPHTAQPTRIATELINFATGGGVVVDGDLGPSGNFYLMQNRSNGGEAGVTVVDPTGAELWNSLQATTDLGLDIDSTLSGTQDVLRRANGIVVSPDGKWMAVNRTDNLIWVLPLDANGIPDLSRRLAFNGFGTTTIGRDISFDAAGNLYLVSSGYQALRVFSPGGTSITTLSSDGTFTTQNAATPEWLATGSGTTTTAANWPLNVVPNASGAFVKFGSAITAPSTVTLGANTTYGSIIFDNPTNAYTLAGAALTLNSPTFQTAPTIYVNGNHTIASPTTISRTATVSVNTGSTLTLSGGLSGSGGLTVNGGNTGAGGTVAITAPANIGSLSIRTNSTVKLSGSNTTASKFTNISTFTTAGTPPVDTFVGTLDITDSKLVINYASTTTNASEALRLQLLQAYQGGNWTGLGVTSSLAAADPQKIRGIGYVEANDALGAAGTWFGQSTDANALLVGYTYKGDANLDFTINGDDFALIDRGLQQVAAGTLAAGAARYANGDFNYDGNVDTADYLILDTTKGKLDGTLAPALLADREARFGSDYVASLLVAVPEPTSLGLLAGAAALTASRRRRPSR